MSKRKSNNRQNTDNAKNEQIESIENELDQHTEELADERKSEQDQRQIDEQIDVTDNDPVDIDEEQEEVEQMNQQTEQDQGFDQEPTPIGANDSGGSGKASAAMAMSLLALAGTGYNWYDAKSSKSATGEQIGVDYSDQIQSLEQQIQSLTESQEQLATVASTAGSAAQEVKVVTEQTEQESSGGTETESASESADETTPALAQEDTDSSEDAEMTQAMTQATDETETISEPQDLSESLIAETDDQADPEIEELSETQTEELADNEQASVEQGQDAVAEQTTEEVAEAEAMSQSDEQTMAVAAAPNSDEIKQIAMQQVDAVLAQAKKRLGLNEVSQLLSIGEQRLALAGDVTGAQAAFGIASERLSAFSNPLIDPVRESVSANIESLNAVEVIDKTALTQDLGNLAGAVDGLAFKPLETLADESPTQEAVEETNTEEDTDLTVGESESDTELSLEGASNLLRNWGSKIGDTIGDVGSGIAGDLKDMVRIKKTGPLSDVVLAPEQEYFIRENMKLTLGGAQRAVLQGNAGVYQQNITQAQSLLGEFFDGDNEDVQSVAGRLADLAQINLEPELPDISNSSASLSDVLKQLASADSNTN